MNHDTETLPALILQMVEARLMYATYGEDDQATWRHEAVFAALGEVLDRSGGDDLRYAFELLSDVAWDLADGWACATGSTDGD